MKKDNSWIWIAILALVFLGYNAYQQRQTNAYKQQQCINTAFQLEAGFSKYADPQAKQSIERTYNHQVADCKLKYN